MSYTFIYARRCKTNPVPPPLITTAKYRPSSVRHTPRIGTYSRISVPGLQRDSWNAVSGFDVSKEHSSGPSVTHVVEQERRFLAFSTPYWTCRITCITCDFLRAWTPAGIPILWKPSEPPTLHIARTGAK